MEDNGDLMASIVVVADVVVKGVEEAGETGGTLRGVLSVLNEGLVLAKKDPVDAAVTFGLDAIIVN